MNLRKYFSKRTLIMFVLGSTLNYILIMLGVWIYYLIFGSGLVIGLIIANEGGCWWENILTVFYWPVAFGLYYLEINHYRVADIWR